MNDSIGPARSREIQLTLTFDGKVQVTSGTAAAPSLRFRSEATGLYLSSAGVLGVAVSGVAANVRFGAGFVAVGATPATIGAYRLTNNEAIYARNSANTADPELLYLDASDRINIGLNNASTIRLQVSGGVVVDVGSGYLNYQYGTTALGGGAAPTVGTIGGSGPAAAAQNSWLKVKIAGTDSFLPVWR